MDDSSTTSRTLDQTDEDILACTVSDEAPEAAAGTERVWSAAVGRLSAAWAS